MVEANKIALMTFIKAKSEKYEFLNGRISAATIAPKIENFVNKIFEELKLVLSDTSLQYHKNQYMQLKNNINFMISYVTNIAYNKQQVQLGWKVKSLSIWQKADVKIVDTNLITLTIAINAVLRKQNTKQKNSWKRKGMSPLLDSPLLSNVHSGKNKKTSPFFELRNSLRPWQGEKRQKEEELVVHSRR